MRARRALRAFLAEAGITAAPEAEAGDRAGPDLADTVLLLASELCDNAVLHAGTAYHMIASITETAVTITVIDHGSGPLEHYLNAPRPTTGRAAAHSRGLLLVDKISTAWGTRHDSTGHHTWFRLDRQLITQAARIPLQTGPVQSSQSPLGGSLPKHRALSPAASPAAAASRLLHLPLPAGDELPLAADLAELLRRLCELTEIAAATITVDYADGHGPLALAALGPSPGEHRAVTEVAIPVNAPLSGWLTVAPGPMSGSFGDELVRLCAHRIALSVESSWLRSVDQRQRARMAYLSEASELLSQPRDVWLTAVIVPQIVVPRLAAWCGVHLYDSGNRLVLAALNHSDENQLETLREALTSGVGEPTPLAQVQNSPIQLTTGSLSMIAVPLTSRGLTHGVLTVAARAQQAHSAEEMLVIRDLARRAALAIGNAKHLAQHKTTSQALQRALLPRAVPTAPGIEFAADYLPASSASAVGGDFYDVLELIPNTQWHIVIGDVCGKGPEAAARTGLIRDVLRVVLRENRPITQAIGVVNDVLMEARDPHQFCTLATALISRAAPEQPPGLSVQLVLAGHEPLILLRADGATELIGTAGTALGLVSTAPVTPSLHSLYPGDTLIAYTDGVTEQRRRLHSGASEQFGQARLLAMLPPAAGFSAVQIVTHIRDSLANFGAEPQYDDIALLVVRALPDERVPGSSPSRVLSPLHGIEGVCVQQERQSQTYQEQHHVQHVVGGVQVPHRRGRPVDVKRQPEHIQQHVTNGLDDNEPPLPARPS